MKQSEESSLAKLYEYMACSYFAVRRQYMPGQQARAVNYEAVSLLALSTTLNISVIGIVAGYVLFGNPKVHPSKLGILALLATSFWINQALVARWIGYDRIEARLAAAGADGVRRMARFFFLHFFGSILALPVLGILMRILGS